MHCVTFCRYEQRILNKSRFVDLSSSHMFLHSQEHAFESSQKYKEGKFIIELAHMIKENKWDWTGDGHVDVD